MKRYSYLIRYALLCSLFFPLSYLHYPFLLFPHTLLRFYSSIFPFPIPYFLTSFLTPFISDTPHPPRTSSHFSPLLSPPLLLFFFPSLSPFLPSSPPSLSPSNLPSPLLLDNVKARAKDATPRGRSVPPTKSPNPRAALTMYVRARTLIYTNLYNTTTHTHLHTHKYSKTHATCILFHTCCYHSLLQHNLPYLALS